MKKRIFVLILCATLLLAMFPAAVGAANPLETPTGLTISSTGTTINATWTAVANATGYKLSVQRISPSTGATYGQNPTSTSISIDNVLTMDGVYSITLFAYSTDKETYANSAPATATFYYTTGGIKPYIVTQPQPVTCNIWDDANFSLDVGLGTNELNDETIFLYQWQLSMDDGENWADIADETFRNLTVSGVHESVNGNLYRCKVWYDSATLEMADIMVITQPVLLTVTMPVTVSIAGAPSSTVPVGAAVNLTAALTGSPTLSSGTLVWYSNTENGITGENVSQVADSTDTFAVDTTKEGTMYYFCTWEDGGMAVYSNVITVTVSKASYIITAGAAGEWTTGSSSGLSFTSNGAFNKYVKTQVDGKDVDPGSLKVESGSTIVTLSTAYLETLSTGTHTLRIVHEGGYSETTFTIIASNTDTPKTGDPSMLWLWTGIALTAIIGMGVVIVLNHKNHKAN